MSILYKPQMFTQPGVVGGGIPQYRAAIVIRGTIHLDQLIQDIEEMTLIHGADVVGVVAALRSRLGYYLSYGNIVVIDEFGTFYPGMQSYVCNSQDQVNVSLIKRISIGYKPCPSLRKVISNVTFEKARKKFW